MNCFIKTTENVFKKCVYCCDLGLSISNYVVTDTIVNYVMTDTIVNYVMTYTIVNYVMTYTIVNYVMTDTIVSDKNSNNILCSASVTHSGCLLPSLIGHVDV